MYYLLKLLSLTDQCLCSLSEMVFSLCPQSPALSGVFYEILFLLNAQEMWQLLFVISLLTNKSENES